MHARRRSRVSSSDPLARTPGKDRGNGPRAPRLILRATGLLAVVLFIGFVSWIRGRETPHVDRPPSKQRSATEDEGLPQGLPAFRPSSAGRESSIGIRERHDVAVSTVAGAIEVSGGDSTARGPFDAFPQGVRYRGEGVLT